MSRKIIDLSVALTDKVRSDPPGLGPGIEYVDHDAGARDFEAMFGMPVDKQREGKGAAVERLQVTTHNGTHMDAPWHYHPTMNNGEPAMTIDQVPLEWCMGPGVKLDFRHLPDGHVVSVAEVEAELARIGHDLEPGDIVLVNTRAGSRYGQDDYVSAGCGMGREATLFLTERGVKVCGTDAWSWDAPLMSQMKKIRETGAWNLFWEGHKAGAETIYCHMEKLGNLDQLPGKGFEVMCFPVKVERGSAGWCRPVAILDI
ncbi:cyclase family protein [Pelagibacterium halotolerans]|uniref:Metal-dependent hydrolase n=1 Tax=Pelagibacterium halotolerans (strain DSM 22347 / JCM 15775 / CGMCC 1.7692 / B2) TaxID=1082931 RepID=G4R7C2_PELHB|nr:cyclase family protein [Pelagibacterium halotolerans]AEQ51258.1 metal-dependent hydrolase [Pelagibacterium halotolerans B2]QJR18883.1 cyclase family protein [Pelagibacterium halotolerans]SEA67067.1 Kynurenine formamidase [Pelagibacterium halotolerans]